MTLVRSDEGRSSLRPVEVQQPRQESLVLDEEIDLRELVRLLIQHWKAIAGVLMVFVAAAFILNTFVLTPTYESYAVVTFRNADLGLDLPVLRALASSPAVMTEIQRQVGFEGQLGELAERFEFVVESSGSLFTVKAQSDDPRHAELLVRAWIAAVESQVSQALEGRLAQQVSNAEANFSAARAALSEAEEALAAFDREHSLDLMEARLWRDKQKLVSDEATLENLKTLAIPTKEATLGALREALNQESAAVESSPSLPGVTANGAVLTQLNPTYFELRRQVSELESSLAADRVRVEVLERELADLRVRVADADRELLEAKLERTRLAREVSEARSLFEAARQEWEEALALKRRLETRPYVQVVSEPTLPDRPVSPRKMLNLALAAVLGSMVGVFGVLFIQWWKAPVASDKAKAVSQAN